MSPCCNTLTDSPLDEETAQTTSDLFKVLADPVRLRLLSLVASQPDREICACDLVDVLGRSQSTISHHLKVLHGSGLLTRERRGTWIHYGVTDEIAHATHIVFSAVPSVKSGATAGVSVDVASVRPRSG